MSLSEKRWFRTMVGIILILLIAFLLEKTLFVFTPVFVLIKTIFLPFVISGVLFYLCRPLIKWLEKRRIPNWLAIIIVYLVIILFFYIFYKLVTPVINDQLERLMNNLPSMINVMFEGIEYVQKNMDLFPDFQEAALSFSGDFEQKLTENIGNISSGIISFVGGFVNTIFYLFLVPFILLYMLKDGDRFQPSVAKFFPENKRGNILAVLKDMDKTISSYVQGQVMVSVSVGLMLFIGYLIIGLDYSIILAIFGMFTNVIPFLGPYLAVIPAFLVALFQEPIMAIYVAIIMLIAQQVEGNVISPQVMGKTLNIHPLTIIILILTAGNLVGILGIIFAIPTYAVAKVVISHAVKLYKISIQESR
ncbi:AI-2E family transporter [Cytobacillus sp. Hm23]|uniref:AI-2E family transporter n=1 Tax=Cytobacillus sp. IB215665 TaxID=3097357 RepID=UPI002A10256E|nr:AI-2E family transporter [Cytobacillus sp. IB215665]MDX8366344.1 AI-2E family transporter [Cytobacillus sp. IB215665]